MTIAPVRAAPSLAAIVKEKRFVTLLLYTRWRGRK